jgi:uncharacterized cupredoxin-like copper-binding protein
MERGRLAAMGVALWSAVAVAIVALCPGWSEGAGDLTNQRPIELQIQLGNEHDALRFWPSTIELETGKLYKLVLQNPSPQKHYFSSEGMSRAVFTRKVQINGPGGKPIAEVKGVVREIEVYPGGTAEWWFIPLKTGSFDDLRCTIRGHAEGGMVGRIVIQ